MNAFVTLAGLVSLLQSPDSLDVVKLRDRPTIDGHVDEREYGRPAVRFATGAGDVCVWVGRHDAYVYLAAALPDSTFYWGDDFVVSLDPDGSGGASPGAGDRQWYLRRVLDSSIVVIALDGRWFTPAEAPPSLGLKRHDPVWDVAARSDAVGWSVELRIATAVVRTGTAAPRLAIRTYNDRPQGWWSWPDRAPRVTAQRVERSPDLWVPLRLR